jgi:crossover junction endodeoxyribonuclease RuvC
MPVRLVLIYDELDRLIKVRAPGVVVVETLYSHYRHPATLGVLAQVKGIVAMLAQRNKLRYCEFSTTRARKSFMGTGSADSGRVKKMAENLVSKKFMSVHTADAFSLVSAFAAEEATKKLRGV